MPARISNKKSLSLEEMKSVTQDAITRVFEIIDKEPSVLIYAGNGISPQELSTNNIPADFINEQQKEYVHEYGDFIKSAKETIQTLDWGSSTIQDMGMVEFIEALNKFEKLKKLFISHVKKICCRARPNDKHYSLYSFCTLLNAIRAIKRKEKPKGLEAISQLKPIIKIFTSNYDNLIEKAYLFRNNQNHPQLWKARLGETGSFDQEKFIEAVDYIPLIPIYLFDFDNLSNQTGMLPIVPIHNSIRAIKCDTCGELLQSEIIGMGEQFCIFCGSKVPDIIVPTQEAKASEHLYNLLFKEIRAAEIVIFVGYGFGDNYINSEMIKILDSIESRKIIINYCRQSLFNLEEFKGCLKKHDVFDIIYDLPHSLDYSNFLIADVSELKSELKELQDVWRLIFSIHEISEKGEGD